MISLECFASQKAIAHTIRATLSSRRSSYSRKLFGFVEGVQHD